LHKVHLTSQNLYLCPQEKAMGRYPVPRSLSENIGAITDASVSQ
jgi:hypothetical protein